MKKALQYILETIRPSGIVLLALGTAVSVYGWVNGMIAVGVAGLSPWAVAITDLLTRRRKRR